MFSGTGFLDILPMGGGEEQNRGPGLEQCCRDFCCRYSFYLLRIPVPPLFLMHSQPPISSPMSQLPKVPWHGEVFWPTSKPGGFFLEGRGRVVVRLTVLHYLFCRGLSWYIFSGIFTHPLTGGSGSGSWCVELYLSVHFGLDGPVCDSYQDLHNPHFIFNYSVWIVSGRSQDGLDGYFN